MSSIFKGVLDAFELIRFQPNFKYSSSRHMQNIHNVIKDNSTSQEHPNHHQLQPKIYKCHQSLREFLMPSNSSNFNQILNIATSGHVNPIQNVIKDTSTSQEHQNHLQLQTKIYKFIIPSGHVQAIHNVIKDTSPSREHQNNHQLQQEL